MPVLLMLLWILLSGRITAEILLFGVGITALVYVFMLRVPGWGPKKDLKLLKALPVFLVYLLNLVKEIAVAAVTLKYVKHCRSPRRTICEVSVSQRS